MPVCGHSPRAVNTGIFASVPEDFIHHIVATTPQIEYLDLSGCLDGPSEFLVVPSLRTLILAHNDFPQRNMLSLPNLERRGLNG